MAGRRLLMVAPLALALAGTPAAVALASRHHHHHHKGHHRAHHRAKTYKVDVRDYYYTPQKLRIHEGDKVKWQWPSTGGDSHDVSMDSGPKGVKPFNSDIASSGYHYTVKFRKAGKYHIVCTLHSEMTMDIKVKKR